MELRVSVTLKLTDQGAYAQYICANEQMCLPKPENVSWVQAAAIPENWLTGKR